EIAAQALPRGLEGRKETDDEARPDRGGRRNRDRAAVERDIADVRHARRYERDDRVEQGARAGQADGRAGAGDEKVFDDGLADDPAARGAEREPHRDLAAAADETLELQVS